MAEDNASDDGLFSEIGKWMSLALDCNKTLVEGALEEITKPHKQVEAALGSLTSFAQSLLNCDPLCVEKLFDNQIELIINQLSLMESTVERMSGKKADPVIRPSIHDRRFIDDEWSDNPFFDFIKQSYLLNNQALTNMVDCLSLSEPDKEKVGFYVRQVSSALAPSNFPLSNPEIVRRIQESKGASLIRGVEQFIEDRKKSGDFLNVCMSDNGSFVLGENIARTAGKVVYENPLMQLIQYSPVMDQVHQVPLLFIPSWVNKYYIYDLREKNSMVKWALDQGYTVFMISWVNPDEAHRDYGFDDYLESGLFTALEQVKQITGEPSVNCAGYCLGGALLAAGTAYAGKTNNTSIQSATYLATSFDFTDPGDLRVMLDDFVIGGVSKDLEEHGYLDGRALAVSFSMLRENELYWNYYIQNYLKGERPSGFDILHWNSDSTNLTASMHEFVMRKLVRGNMFTQDGGFEILGEMVSLSDIKVPVYILATEKDHIAKWQSCYAGLDMHGGTPRFVLTGSGHIAGVINPPSGNKYHYYTNNRAPHEPEEWLDGAFKHEGSWWPDWNNWLLQHSGMTRSSVEIDRSRTLENAPGRYVKRRLDESQPNFFEADTQFQQGSQAA